MVRLPVKAHVKKGLANPHIAHMRVMADKVQPRGPGRRRPIKAGASYHITADDKIMTHNRLLDSWPAKKLGSLVISAPPSGGVVTIEHNLRFGGAHDSVTERQADIIENVVKEHFSPQAIKFIRK